MNLPQARSHSPSSPKTLGERESILSQKAAYEKFSIRMMKSSYLNDLARKNYAYRHVLRFAFHILSFALLFIGIRAAFGLDRLLGLALLPLYVFVQGFLISGLMIHSHELSHNQIKNPWLNQGLGIVSGLISWINFYSFQEAHRLHHRNIGNIDSPEAGAPISRKGQDRLLDEDKLYHLMARIYDKSKVLWYLSSWVLFIGYGDYNSWLFPFRTKKSWNYASIANFVLLALVNLIFAVVAPLEYFVLYLLPMVTGGNAILAITFMHHAHEDSIFFNDEHHNIFNTIMATTDRDFGPFINFLMMNNGYHIPHHLNPHIAWYDLKKANAYLRSELPEELRYNYYPKSRFFYDLFHGFYEKRLDHDPEYYQLRYVK